MSVPHRRLCKLFEFAGSGCDVADSWCTGDFEATYDDVQAGCAWLLAWLGSDARGRIV